VGLIRYFVGQIYASWGFRLARGIGSFQAAWEWIAGCTG